MERRELLAIVSGLGVAALGGAALAAEEHAGHDMGSMHDHMDHAAHEHGGRVTKYAALMSAAAHCATAAQDCLAHCVEALSAGDTSMKECARTSLDVIDACNALAALASRNAVRLPEFAAACGKICRDCEAECRKQEKHAVCAACRDSCAACAAECEKLAA